MDNVDVEMRETIPKENETKEVSSSALVRRLIDEVFPRITGMHPQDEVPAQADFSSGKETGHGSNINLTGKKLPAIVRWLGVIGEDGYNKLTHGKSKDDDDDEEPPNYLKVEPHAPRQLQSELTVPVSFCRPCTTNLPFSSPAGLSAKSPRNRLSFPAGPKRTWIG